MKTIGIIGGTGFTGTYLTDLLVEKGYQVIIFTRQPQKKSGNKNVTFAAYNAYNNTADSIALKKLDAVVHLAGAGVVEKRWSEERKKEILDSRVISTRFLLSQLKQHASNCKTFIAASAIGIYGPDKEANKPFQEAKQPYPDFLGDTCKQWEEESAKGAESMRTVILRIGIVLGKGGGAYPEFAKPLKFGVMPILGSGNQMVSWIEIIDLVRMMLFGIENNHISGVYNAVATHPVTHKKLMQTIGDTKGGLRIPIPVPSIMLKIMLGEMSIEILKSCNVSNQKILDSGFKFNNPEIGKAINAIMNGV